MTVFDYLECPACDWSAVMPSPIRSGFYARIGACCPLCAEDCGKLVPLRCREATADDKPEAYDGRRPDTAH